MGSKVKYARENNLPWLERKLGIPIFHDPPSYINTVTYMQLTLLDSIRVSGCNSYDDGLLVESK